jgi:hypothetical protein
MRLPQVSFSMAILEAVTSVGGMVNSAPRGGLGEAGGRLRAPRAAPAARLVNGSVGVVMAPQGRLSRALTVKIADGKITEIEVIGDPARLGQLDVSIVD